MKSERSLPSIHRAILTHLQKQGFYDVDACNAFLYPRLCDLPPPFSLSQIGLAVDLILSAISSRDDVLIWGDYDVDGITATALMIIFFREIGVDVSFYIPDRLSEGYGINGEKLLQLSQGMTENKLLITVDCGISNSQEIKAAKHLGFKVIVTDHHQVPDEPLCADATINPRQKGCLFPFKELSGVGVAFYLIWAVRTSLGKDANSACNKINLKSFLDLVCIGTIADVMPLVGVNRVLVKAGFETIAENCCKSKLPVLLSHYGILPSSNITSDLVSFQIAPTINAAGRLGKAFLPLKLLIAQADEDPEQLVEQLVGLNDKRKSLTKRDLQNALNKIDIDSIYRDKCIVLVDDFHDGILGITASRLVELYSVPSLVCAVNKTSGLIKGSGRAPAGFNLFEALVQCHDFLVGYGGHAAAAGFSITGDGFERFKDKFISYASHVFDHKTRQIENNHIALSVSEALNPVLLGNLRQLEPLGEGNPRPIFIDSEVRLVAFNYFGFNQDHFRGIARGTHQNVEVIGFNLGKKIASLDPAAPFSMVYSHMTEFYRGRQSVKIRAESVWQ